MPEEYTRKVRKILRGKVNLASIEDLSKIAVETEEQAQILSKQLELITMPVLAKKRGIELMFTPAELSQKLRRIRPLEPMKSVLDLFLMSLLFRRRPGLFAETSLKGTPNGPVPAYLKESSSHVSALFEAAVSYARKQNAWILYHEAKLQFEAAELPTLHHFNGLKFARPLETLKAMASAPSKNSPIPHKIDIEPGTFKNDLPIFLIGVDNKYFDLYSDQLIETAKDHANLHFHIANPGPVVATGSANVRYSTEYVHQGSAAYFASMRFLRLPELLAHYQKSITVIDADSIFTRSVDEFLASVGSADLSVNINHNAPGQFFWRHFNAQTLHAPCQAPTFRLMEKLSNLFSHMYNTTTSCWWIDQAILAQAISLEKITDPDLSIANAQFGRTSGIKQKKLRASS